MMKNFAHLREKERKNVHDSKKISPINFHESEQGYLDRKKIGILRFEA